MKKLSREKIALIIFALLVVCGFGALMFYITNIGHSFNVTASTIDDAAGDLGDYTAIIYEGTAEEKKALGEAGLNASRKMAATRRSSWAKTSKWMMLPAGR